MAKNQRQRRPLQDEGRSNKQTVRERAQASRRQRDRIEENRDRREQRRERQRLRRQTVDSIRSPKEDVRIDRMDSRLVPIEDTFLGRPVGEPTDLPVTIGERWYIGSGQFISNDTETTINYDTSSFTTERNGYPSVYQGSGVWRIPAALRGVWLITASVYWPGVDTGKRIATLEFTDGTDIATDVKLNNGSSDPVTHIVTTQYLFQEGDEFRMRAYQNTGSSVSLTGGVHTNWMFAWFIGK